jgi:hypothetical protein
MRNDPDTRARDDTRIGSGWIKDPRLQELEVMPLPRVRFTIRRMMAAVALVAVLLGGDQMRRKVETCGEIARLLKEQEATYQRLAAVCEEDEVKAQYRIEEFDKLEASEEGRELAARNPDLFQALKRSSRASVRYAEEGRECREKARRFRAKREMYERAMLRPWEPIPTEVDPQ